MGRMNKAISLQGIGSTGFFTELATQICTLNSNLSYDTTTKKYRYTLKWYGKPLLQWNYNEDDSQDTMVTLNLYQVVGKTQTNIGPVRYVSSGESVHAGGTYTRTLYMIGMTTDNFLYLSFNPEGGSFSSPIVFFAAKVADTSADDGYRILSSAIKHPGTQQEISRYLADVTTGAAGYSIVHRLPYERSDSQAEIISSKLILSGVTVAYTLTDAIDTTNIGINSVYSISGKNYYTVSPNMAVLYNEK